MRIGNGYDVHQLTLGRKLMLGGVEIPHTRGLLGHSDADVLTHAIMDALLGALALGNIGDHFPDTDKIYKDKVLNLYRLIFFLALIIASFLYILSDLSIFITLKSSFLSSKNTSNPNPLFISFQVLENPIFFSSFRGSKVLISPL